MDSRIDRIDRVIKRLELQSQGWAEEYRASGPKGTRVSGLRKSDLDFIERQIARLKSAKMKMEKAIADVEIVMSNHTKDW